MTKALVKTQVRLHQMVNNREAGQGTLEYVGMILVAAVIVVAVMGVLKPDLFKTKLAEAVKSVLG